MVYAIISDIHANESALRDVLADARAKGAERIVCLGDAVGYGPLPDETVRLLRESCDFAIAGNHDDAVSGRIDAEDFIDLAGDAVRRHRADLSSENAAWLRALDYEIRTDGFAAVHGDFTAPRAFNYVDDEQTAAANFAARGEQLLFVGHTHVPGLFLTGESGRVYRLGPTDFTLEPGKRYIVNPGSVGYPRETNGVCLSTYALYDTDARTVTFQSIPFAVASVMQRGAGTGRRRTWLAVSLAALALAAAAASAFLFAGDGPDEDDPALVFRTEERAVGPGLRHFSPGLELGKSSDPVTLRYVFLDGDGKVVKADSARGVKRSLKRTFAVPAGAAKLRLTLLRQSPGSSVEVERFDPQLDY